ncbi:RES family NAD+ phosphorylase [Steroidobacter flavus]|uniref:RES family NAD+ phosphorylase n=1 Tax=Steroidobacter flavus TaxID=1842136 RepID=A0ABV8T479_9GAMM
MSYICSNCIGEEFLRNLVAREASQDEPCEYCEREESPTVEIGFIADRCDAVIETFYELSSQTAAVIHFDRTPAGDDLPTVIQKLVRVNEAAVTAIVETLSDKWFDGDSMESRYGDDDDPWFVLKSHLGSAMSARWAEMESSLRNEARHLNPNVAEFMGEVFGDIAADVTAKGSSVLVDAGPGSSIDKLFRAREFQTEKGLYDALHHPEKFLGAPAVGIGRAGRMNAAGQPAFYGATDADIALAEVRPAVGSYTVVATFAITRPLKLLDLGLLMEVRLKEGASLFDPMTKAAAERRDFLKTLCTKMTLPVVPEGQDHDYLITQVVADYLAMHPRASIDGIVYPSVQFETPVGKNEERRGQNIVLFHKAATTLYADSMKSTGFVQLYQVDSQDSEEYWYPCIEFGAPEPESSYFQRPGFNPKPALELVRDSIHIHRITSVKIFSDDSPVRLGTLGPWSR